MGTLGLRCSLWVRLLGVFNLLYMGFVSKLIIVCGATDLYMACKYKFVISIKHMRAAVLL